MSLKHHIEFLIETCALVEAEERKDAIDVEADFLKNIQSNLKKPEEEKLKEYLKAIDDNSPYKIAAIMDYGRYGGNVNDKLKCRSKINESNEIIINIMEQVPSNLKVYLQRGIKNLLREGIELDYL